MGIPRFAAWLTKKFPPMVRRDAPGAVHGLYIDMNGIIHPCCHSEEDPSVAKRTEEEKIEQVCLTVANLVDEAKPNKILFLAMDGVAPRAKMNQQRARRYMSAVPKYGVVGQECVAGGGMAPREHSFTAEERAAAQADIKAVAKEIDLGIYGDSAGAGAAAEGSASDDKKDRSKFYAKRGGTDEIDCGETNNVSKPAAATEDPSHFDSNCISPGTVFMKKCSDRLKVFVSDKLASHPHWAGLSVIVSDTNTPGEGEHKIIDFIRTQMGYGSAWPGMGYHVIHGNDADLILLGLGLHVPRVVLLRENYRTGGPTPAAPSAAAAALGLASPPSPTGLPTPDEKAAKESDSELSAAASDAEGGAEGEKPAADKKKDTTKKKGARKGGKGRWFAPKPRFEWFDIDTVGGCIVTELYELSKKVSPILKDCPDMQTYTESQKKKIVVGAGGVGQIVPAGAAGGKKKGGRKDASANKDDAPAAVKGGEPRVWTDAETEAAVAQNHAAHLQRSLIPTSAATGYVLAHPCTMSCNHRVVDDFITLATLMGNDFMPRLPSCFCGDSAMDNIMEVYVRCVMPYGYLSNPITNDLDLVQLHRFFHGYAMLETSLFRQHCIKNNLLTPAEAMSLSAESLGGSARGQIALPSPIDAKWRSLYYNSTTIGPTPDGLKQACTSYIEGIRFVLRYYSTTSRTTSWSWYFPFHHSPFAADIANFLAPYAKEKKPEEALPPPKLELVAPLPVPQLMAILPPTSSKLLPAAIGKIMRNPPPEMQNTFPAKWRIDYTAADDQEHLAAVLLPFADFKELMATSEALKDTFTEDEKARNVNVAEQCVLMRKQPPPLLLASPPAIVLSSPPTATEGEVTESEMSSPPTAFVVPTPTASPVVPPIVVDDISAETKLVEDRVRGGIQFVKNVAGHEGTVLEFSYVDIPSKFYNKNKTYSHSYKPLDVLLGSSNSADGNTVADRDEKNAKKYKRRNFENNKVDVAGRRYWPKNFLAATEKGWFMSLADFHLGVGFIGAATGFVMTLVGAAANDGSCLICAALTNAVVTAFLFTVGAVLLCILGVGVTNPRKESGIKRNAIYDAYVDWLCSKCLSLNFSRNEKCYTCGAPCDELSSSWALFSSKMNRQPPHLDPNHLPYIMDIVVRFPTDEDGEGVGSAAAKTDIADAKNAEEGNCDML